MAKKSSTLSNEEKKKEKKNSTLYRDKGDGGEEEMPPHGFSLALKSYLIANCLANPFASLCSHSFCYTESGNSAWLGAQDATLLVAGTAVIQDHLGNLSRNRNIPYTASPGQTHIALHHLVTCM